ncbi:hypothetical protein M2162_002819 [Streptomyces sp. SAI-041]|nr:hypothetical protein [Streptomyces sp. SAI-041]
MRGCLRLVASRFVCRGGVGESVRGCLRLASRFVRLAGVVESVAGFLCLVACQPVRLAGVGER